MNLTWHGKDEAVKTARNTPYHLLRERAELSYPPQGTTATADSRQQTADSRQQTADSRQQ